MIKYIFLGIIQGLTEFFPVSSSGHLVIMQKLTGIRGEEVALPIILHLGTVFALLLFFYKDILALLRNLKLLSLIFIVTLITGIIGVAGKDFFEGLFSSTRPLAASFLFTGIILILTKRFMEGKKTGPGLKDAVILGFTQAIAIVPGISRSGMTISTLLFRGISRQDSFKFSFLVSIPVILGATLFEARKLNLALQANFNNFLAGFIASILSGIFSLWLLKIILKKAKLHYFGYYCIAMAIISFFCIR